MVIAFEERDRAAIESKGITVIEFKRIVYRIAEIISGACNAIKDFVDKIEKAWDALKCEFFEAVENVKFLCTEVIGTYSYSTYPTMRRYKVVKVLSKCTGIEMCSLWKMTHRIWLARSCL